MRRRPSGMRTSTAWPRVLPRPSTTWTATWLHVAEYLPPALALLPSGILHPGIRPLDHLGQSVQHRLSGAIGVPVVRQHDEPGRGAVPLQGLEHALRLNRERAGVRVVFAVDQ